MIFVDQNFTLFLGKTGIRKHSDLINNMVPISRNTQFNQIISQSMSHFNDSFGNFFDFEFPVIVILGVVQDSGNNLGTVSWGVGVGWSDDQFHLTQNAVCGCFVAANNMEASGSFSVQSHVFGETLGDYALETGLHE